MDSADRVGGGGSTRTGQGGDRRTRSAGFAGPQSDLDFSPFRLSSLPLSCQCQCSDLDGRLCVGGPSPERGLTPFTNSSLANLMVLPFFFSPDVCVVWKQTRLRAGGMRPRPETPRLPLPRPRKLAGGEPDSGDRNGMIWLCNARHDGCVIADGCAFFCVAGMAGPAAPRQRAARRHSGTPQSDGQTPRRHAGLP